MGWVDLLILLINVNERTVKEYFFLISSGFIRDNATGVCTCGLHEQLNQMSCECKPGFTRDPIKKSCLCGQHEVLQNETCICAEGFYRVAGECVCRMHEELVNDVCVCKTSFTRDSLGFCSCGPHEVTDLHNEECICSPGDNIEIFQVHKNY